MTVVVEDSGIGIEDVLEAVADRVPPPRGDADAPLQALMYGYDWRGMLTWISLGFPMDVLHAVGNLAAGLLILPLSDLLRKLNVRFRIGA